MQLTAIPGPYPLNLGKLNTLGLNIKRLSNSEYIVSTNDKQKKMKRNATTWK